MRGVREPDQRLRACVEVKPVQARSAVLGHHPIHVGAGHDNIVCT